jgi:thioredoxin-related protein
MKRALWKPVFILLTLAFVPLSGFKGHDTTQEKTGVKWHTIQEAEQLMKKEPRKVYIDMYTDWCKWCKVMEQNTFSDDRIIKLLNTKYYAVRFDAEGKDPVDFKGKTFKFVPQGRNGYHELAAVLMKGKLSYPTSVFLDEDLNLITPLPGYVDANKMEPILEFIGEDHYKNQTYQDFLARRK